MSLEVNKGDKDMTPMEQIQYWVKGKPIHDIDTGLCVPDFSCCFPQLLASQLERDLFYRAYTHKHNERLIRIMLQFFFEASMLSHGRSEDIEWIKEREV